MFTVTKETKCLTRGKLYYDNKMKDFHEELTTISDDLL